MGGYLSWNLTDISRVKLCEIVCLWGHKHASGETSLKLLHRREQTHVSQHLENMCSPNCSKFGGKMGLVRILVNFVPVISDRLSPGIMMVRLPHHLWLVPN
jgi:hypothetical protein